MKKVKDFNDLRKGVLYNNSHSRCDYYYKGKINKNLAEFIQIISDETGNINIDTIILNKHEIKDLRYSL